MSIVPIQPSRTPKQHQDIMSYHAITMYIPEDTANTVKPVPRFTETLDTLERNVHTFSEHVAWLYEIFIHCLRGVEVSPCLLWQDFATGITSS